MVLGQIVVFTGFVFAIFVPLRLFPSIRAWLLPSKSFWENSASLRLASKVAYDPRRVLFRRDSGKPDGDNEDIEEAAKSYARFAACF